MAGTPEVAVLFADGINCDQEMGHAFEVAGANQSLVHVNQLQSGDRSLSDYDILALPGGFSYGDGIASGAVLANKLTTRLGDDLAEFVDAKKPIIGVCNGFQVLVRAGILPGLEDDSEPAENQASLVFNTSGKLICKWVELETNPRTSSPFLDGVEWSIPMQISHGEGRFITADESILSRIIDEGLVAFRYKDNPNGSEDDIAGITSPNGLILGMMPHPERSIRAFPPDRRQRQQAREPALRLFRNIVNYAKES